jgi:hypothetical protein
MIEGVQLGSRITGTPPTKPGFKAGAGDSFLQANNSAPAWVNLT